MALSHEGTSSRTSARLKKSEPRPEGSATTNAELAALVVAVSPPVRTGIVQYLASHSQKESSAASSDVDVRRAAKLDSLKSFRRLSHLPELIENPPDQALHHFRPESRAGRRTRL